LETLTTTYLQYTLAVFKPTIFFSVGRDVDHYTTPPGPPQLFLFIYISTSAPHPIVVAVLLVEKECHVSDGVAVPGHAAGAGKAHGDDPAGHVRQVEVDPVLLVAPLILKIAVNVMITFFGDFRILSEKKMVFLLKKVKSAEA
jgi:hypothetical protein